MALCARRARDSASGLNLQQANNWKILSENQLESIKNEAGWTLENRLINSNFQLKFRKCALSVLNVLANHFRIAANQRDAAFVYKQTSYLGRFCNCTEVRNFIEILARLYSSRAITRASRTDRERCSKGVQKASFKLAPKWAICSGDFGRIIPECGFYILVHYDKWLHRKLFN